MENVFQIDQLLSVSREWFLAVHYSTHIHDTSDRSLSIQKTLNLYFQHRKIVGLTEFLICERLAVASVFECDFRDKFVKEACPK